MSSHGLLLELRILCLTLFFQKLGKQYGYQPKFVRMKTMHKLLFYLIHDYAGVSDLDQQAVKETLNDITPISVEIEREMPPVYFPAVDWRMFIPPLPEHSGKYCLILFHSRAKSKKSDSMFPPVCFISELQAGLRGGLLCVMCSCVCHCQSSYM